MLTGQVPLFVLLMLVLLGFAALVWWDIVQPRALRRGRRKKRREDRSRAKIRASVLGDLWKLRGRRRLTDQRTVHSQRGE